jgi:hypothetical protein
MNLNETSCLDESDSEQGPAAGSCEQNSSDSVEGAKCLNYLSYNYLLENVSAS